MYIHMYILSESVVLSTSTSFHYPMQPTQFFLALAQLPLLFVFAEQIYSPNSPSCPKIIQRREWRTLPDEDKAGWLTSVKVCKIPNICVLIFTSTFSFCQSSLVSSLFAPSALSFTSQGTILLGRPSLYDDFAYTHDALGDAAHFNAYFLPWRKIHDHYDTFVRLISILCHRSMVSILWGLKWWWGTHNMACVGLHISSTQPWDRSVDTLAQHRESSYQHNYSLTQRLFSYWDWTLGALLLPNSLSENLLTVSILQMLTISSHRLFSILLLRTVWGPTATVIPPIASFLTALSLPTPFLALLPHPTHPTSEYIPLYWEGVKRAARKHYAFPWKYPKLHRSLKGGLFQIPVSHDDGT